MGAVQEGHSLPSHSVYLLGADTRHMYIHYSPQTSPLGTRTKLNAINANFVSFYKSLLFPTGSLRAELQFTQFTRAQATVPQYPARLKPSQTGSPLEQRTYTYQALSRTGTAVSGSNP